MTTKSDGEFRSLVCAVETRADGDKVTVAGYAAIFGEVATVDGYFKEVVARGAFTKTLRTDDIRAYFDHDRGRVLGRSTAGTLRLKEDEKGLAVEIDLPDTSDGRDVRTLIERGDISGMSFGFDCVRQEWDETTNLPTRTLLEVVLREVSIVSEPVYGGTSIAIRSLDAARTERRQKNYLNAGRRVAERKASAEAKFRKIF